MAEELIRVEEVARRLSLSRSFVYELLARGDLKAVKVGKARRIRVAELDDFVGRVAAAGVVER